MRHKRLVLAVAAVLIAGLFCLSARPTGIQLRSASSDMSDYAGTVNAPEFPAGLQWLNTDGPLHLRDVRGKVVLLDFWTFCCINCMHVIPDLKRLEKKYAGELAVIGVHSAKFTSEKDTENIRQAILRYEVAHPVVNDRDMRVWREYGVNAWPTLVLIDPAGKIVGVLSGEGIYEPLDEAISQVIKAFDAKGLIDRKPLSLRLERDRAPEGVLSFPGKVLADAASGRLFIADSNHNRIVAVSLADSSVLDVAGSGEIGLTDGAFAEAAFNHPQGMALDGQRLYVADTENHAIRLVDFATRRVTTVAGTGQQARQSDVSGPATQTPLNSPWDLLLHNGALYVAMAGSHQLWRMDVKAGRIERFAGSGREARTDGPFELAALAQPSGIATDGRKLYFADSEDSSIRSADLDPRGRVETIVGGDLFEFGDRDGHGLEARLQHPLGVACHDGVLYAADTYNNKIKRVWPGERRAESFLGTGGAGLADGETATFDEPGGLSVAGDKLYVADTNNHVIRVADLKTRRVETLQLKDMERLQAPRKSAFAGKVVALAPQSVEPGDATLTLTVELAPGFRLNAQAPNQLTLAAEGSVSFRTAGGGGGKPAAPEGNEQNISNPHYPVTVPIRVGEGDGAIRADFVVYYCDEGKKNLCYFKEARLSLAVAGRKGAGEHTLRISYGQP